MAVHSVNDKIQHAVAMAFAAAMLLLTGAYRQFPDWVLAGHAFDRYGKTLYLCLLAAVSWEVFWYARRAMKGWQQNTVLEMVLDIFAGMVGAGFVVLAAWLFSVS